MNHNDIYEGLKKTCGILLVILGILGLFLPFLQGILFIVIGITLIGNKKLLDWAYKIKDKFFD